MQMAVEGVSHFQLPNCKCHQWKKIVSPQNHMVNKLDRSHLNPTNNLIIIIRNIHLMIGKIIGYNFFVFCFEVLLARLFKKESCRLLMIDVLKKKGQNSKND